MTKTIQDQKSADTQETYKLDDAAIAGLMQLLSVAIMTGTNMLDHLRLMELVKNDDGRLVMTDDFVTKTEKYCEDCISRIEEDKDLSHVEF